MVVAADDSPYGDPAGPVLDAFVDDLCVAYSFGPPWGERLVSWADLDRLGLSRRSLRRVASRNLDDLLDGVRIHGQPPALMISLEGLGPNEGLESSLLLADRFWEDLARSVPGELVVGVPARDVMIFTGLASRPGLAKVRRAVDRMFLAGDTHLLTPELLVRRRGDWEVLGRGVGLRSA